MVRRGIGVQGLGFIEFKFKSSGFRVRRDGSCGR